MAEVVARMTDDFEPTQAALLQETVEQMGATLAALERTLRVLLVVLVVVFGLLVASIVVMAGVRR